MFIDINNIDIQISSVNVHMSECGTFPNSDLYQYYENSILNINQYILLFYLIFTITQFTINKTNPLFFLSVLLFTISRTNGNDCDIMILLDSSNSVSLVNWRSELIFVKSIINNTLPNTANVGAINYSGCSPTSTFEQCWNYGFYKLWGLQTHLDDLHSVYNSFDAITNNDFIGSRSWTDAALKLALMEFQNYSSNPSEKSILLISDSQATDGYEPCISSTSYKSNTLQQLEAMNVSLFVVAPDVQSPDINEYFNCMVHNVSYQLFQTTWSELLSLSNTVGNKLCSFTFDPTFNPTFEPTMEPTIEPTIETTSTSNPTVEQISNLTFESTFITTINYDAENSDVQGKLWMEIEVVIGCCLFVICFGIGVFLVYYVRKKKHVNKNNKETVQMSNHDQEYNKCDIDDAKLHTENDTLNVNIDECKGRENDKMLDE
eukprot:193906_1